MPKIIDWFGRERRLVVQIALLMVLVLGVTMGYFVAVVVLGVTTWWISTFVMGVLAVVCLVVIFCLDPLWRYWMRICEKSNLVGPFPMWLALFGVLFMIESYLVLPRFLEDFSDKGLSLEVSYGMSFVLSSVLICLVVIILITIRRSKVWWSRWWQFWLIRRFPVKDAEGHSDSPEHAWIMCLGFLFVIEGILFLGLFSA